ncbi:hypothetical protein [Azospirillum thermophilum]|uniref:hypothetical protein n=1 Tax=Azospirillum thermophilum TaxID=2202148 RepID=UPI001FEA07FE|nr:hypothetical protein [Azospirillum thermophilum]
MTILTHIVYALAYAIAGLSVGAVLPYLRPEGDALTGWLAGALIVLAGALVHETVTRLERERIARDRLRRLEERVEALAGEAARTPPAAAEGDRYDAVMQEVKLLQSLVARLTERRAPRPPAAAAERRPPDSGEAALPPQAPPAPPAAPRWRLQ